MVGMPPARAIVLAGAVAGVAALVLAGCSAAPGSPSGPTTAATSVASATPNTTPNTTPSAPSTPTLHPDGSAADNTAYFRLVTTRLLARTAKPTGRELVDNLVMAGFDKANMEVTPDKTAIGLTADAIEFSVKFGTECIVGQKGAEFGLTVIHVPVLETGTCLVGKTRAIDW
ncbi:hypothetical protein BH11ACT2_BH11ACT2_22550 [soil metagenome]